MKILQIFGAVVAVHLLAFIFIFLSPGCQSGPRNQPTPDATMPSATAPTSNYPAYSSTPSAAPQPIDLGTSSSAYNPPLAGGHATPTRPGSANAVALTPAKPIENVAPVSTYTVERGDSLWSIAKKHQMSVTELAKANSITTGTALKPGRKLIIPGKPGAPRDAAAAPAMTTAPATTEKPATGGEAVRHTVQVGESLGVIARRYQVSVGELAAANNITDPSKLRAGQQLVIPGYKSPGRSGNAATSVPRPVAKPVATKPASGGPTPVPAGTAANPAPDATRPADATEAAPHFELTPPPPGQDLDAGLRPSTTEVPTIKVEEASSTPPKS